MIYHIRVLVEATEVEASDLADRIGNLICDDPHDDPGTQCPRRWFIACSPLDADEEAEWDELLEQ